MAAIRLLHVEDPFAPATGATPCDDTDGWWASTSQLLGQALVATALAASVALAQTTALQGADADAVEPQSGLYVPCDDGPPVEWRTTDAMGVVAPDAWKTDSPEPSGLYVPCDDGPPVVWLTEAPCVVVPDAWRNDSPEPSALYVPCDDGPPVAWPTESICITVPDAWRTDSPEPSGLYVPCDDGPPVAWISESICVLPPDAWRTDSPEPSALYVASDDYGVGPFVVASFDVVTVVPTDGGDFAGVVGPSIVDDVGPPVAWPTESICVVAPDAWRTDSPEPSGLYVPSDGDVGAPIWVVASPSVAAPPAPDDDSIAPVEATDDTGVSPSVIGDARLAVVVTDDADFTPVQASDDAWTIPALAAADSACRAPTVFDDGGFAAKPIVDDITPPVAWPTESICITVPDAWRTDSPEPHALYVPMDVDGWSAPASPFWTPLALPLWAQPLPAPPALATDDGWVPFVVVLTARTPTQILFDSLTTGFAFDPLATALTFDSVAATQLAFDPSATAASFDPLTTALTFYDSSGAPMIGPLTIKSGETGAITFALVGKDGNPENLTGATNLTWSVRSANNAPVIDKGTLTVTDAVNGKVSYTRKATDFMTAGTFNAEASITRADGTVGRFPNNGYATVIVVASLTQ